VSEAPKQKGASLRNVSVSGDAPRRRRREDLSALHLNTQKHVVAVQCCGEYGTTVCDWKAEMECTWVEFKVLQILSIGSKRLLHSGLCMAAIEGRYPNNWVYLFAKIFSLYIIPGMSITENFALGCLTSRWGQDQIK